MHYVYYIENLVNGKLYVGKSMDRNTRWRDANARWNEHRRDARKKRTKMPIHHAMNKYGEENFRYNRMEAYATQEEALIAEMAWISYLREQGVELYNITTGGEGTSFKRGPRTAEHSAKIGAQLRGIQAKIKGGTISESHRLNVKATAKQKLTDIQKDEIRELAKAGTHSQAELATIYGVGRDWISRIVNNKTTDKTRSAAKTGRTGKRKLSMEQAQTIRDLYMTRKYSQKELATMFGVNPKSIVRVLGEAPQTNVVDTEEGRVSL